MLYIETLIKTYFKEERTIYFTANDSHKEKEPNTYLRYKLQGDRLELFYGSDNGELCIAISNDADKLERIITLLIY